MEDNANPKTRIRIEDMTLGQIQGLKKEIADDLSGYLAGLQRIISNRFDVGTIGFSVETELLLGREYRHESPTRFNSGVHFSKEDL